MGTEDGVVWGWGPAGTGKEGERGGAGAAGAVADPEVAGAALRECAAFRPGEMGLQDFRAGGGGGTAELGGVPSAATDRGDFGFSLRDALEPVGQPLERRAVHRCDETRSEEHTSELQSHLNLVCRLLLE